MHFSHKISVIGSFDWQSPINGVRLFGEITEIISIENDGSIICRYVTELMKSGDGYFMNPLIKLKASKAGGYLIYFLTERSSQGEIDEVEFETRGLKGNAYTSNRCSWEANAGYWIATLTFWTDNPADKTVQEFTGPYEETAWRYAAEK